MQTQISQVYSYLQITRVINLTASNEELENIQKMQEELYVSELELSELTKRNSFLNRMQDESNRQSKPKFTQRKSIQLLKCTPIIGHFNQADFKVVYAEIRGN